MFERPGRPADKIPAPFPNEQAAAAANGGKAPPDLSLMAKARTFARGGLWFIIDWLPFIGYTEQGRTTSTPFSTATRKSRRRT